MTLDDTFAYIPLFALAVLSVLLIVLLSAIKKKSTARTSFIFYLSTFITLCSSVMAGVIRMTTPLDEPCNAFIIFALGIFLAGIVLIPYCLMLYTFEPKQIVKLVPKSENKRILAAENQNKQAVSPQETEEAVAYSVKMLDLSQDFMVHAADVYSKEEGLSTLLDYLNKTIGEQIKADGSAILMIDDFEDVITVKAFDGDFPPPYKLPNDMPHKPVRIATSFKFASFPLRDNIFGEIATSGKAELITNPAADGRIYQNGPEDFLECGSYIFVPMKIQDVVIGVTAFARKNGTPLFTEDELKTASTLSDSAAAAVKSVITVNDIIENNSISKETEIASHIQDILKPAKLPIISGAEIATIWNPAEGVCGDYYDVVVSRKDRVSFMLGDIAGKSINSIMVMIMIRSMLRLVVNTTQTAGKILTWVNKGIAGESFSTDHFGSVALINYNPEKKQIEFSSGGNMPVFYYDSKLNTMKELSEPSEPIGVEKSSEYKNYVQNVKSGDIIITYTDGLVETLNDKGQQYTRESLLRIITENHNASGKDIVKIVKNDIKKFCGSVSQHDDETLLLVKIQ